MQTFDIESGCDTELLNLNPEGWIAGVSNERNWGMLYGMDVSWHRNVILAGDSHGFVHAVDPRANHPLLGKHQLHKKGNKAGTLMFLLGVFTPSLTIVAENCVLSLYLLQLVVPVTVAVTDSSWAADIIESLAPHLVMDKSQELRNALLVLRLTVFT